MKRMIVATLLALAPAATLAGPDTGHYPYRMGQPAYAQPFHEDAQALAPGYEAFEPDDGGAYSGDSPDQYTDGYGPDVYADGDGEPYDPSVAPLSLDPYAGEGSYQGEDAYGPYSGRYQWRRSGPAYYPTLDLAPEPYAPGPECWTNAGRPC